VVLGGKKLDKFDIPSAEAADLGGAAIQNRTFRVQAVESKPASRNPFAALHDLDPAAGGQPQVRHGRPGDDERGPAAV
jgi:hypothetical protein